MKNKIKDLPPGNYEVVHVNLIEVEITTGRFKGSRLLLPRSVYRKVNFEELTRKPVNWKRGLDKLLDLYELHSWSGNGDPVEIEIKKSNFEIAYKEFLDLIEKEVNYGSIKDE